MTFGSNPDQETLAALTRAMLAAIEEARRFVGTTAPNPPVGAAALSRDGRLLGVAAHPRAGEGHAEARLIRLLGEQGLLAQVHSVAVTLEPCNHFGRTPPCTEALLGLPALKQVLIGARDPNPKVKGGGAEALRSRGIEVFEATEARFAGASGPGSEAAAQCQELIRPFSRWVRTGMPWVTVKTAHRPDGSMVPPPGQKTFTSEDSLRLAHELRKRADALLTGSGTVLADRPEFTVRRVPDHPGKSRWLAILDRRGRVGRDYIEAMEKKGFRVRVFGRPEGREAITEALEFLGKEGCLEVLVEAGPELARSVLEAGIWDRHVVITQGAAGLPDRVEVRERS